MITLREREDFVQDLKDNHDILVDCFKTCLKDHVYEDDYYLFMDVADEYSSQRVEIPMHPLDREEFMIWIDDRDEEMIEEFFKAKTEAEEIIRKEFI